MNCVFSRTATRIDPKIFPSNAVEVSFFSRHSNFLKHSSKRPNSVSVRPRVLCMSAISENGNGSRINSHDRNGRSLKNVVVIGAGASGLACANELRKEGHSVTVLEQLPRIGGIWRLNEKIEKDDLMGMDPGRSKVHSSMYDSLRTNLPRELMSFMDFPSHPNVLGERSLDGRRFCGHQEVLRYLEAYAEDKDLYGLIQFNTGVAKMSLMGDGKHGNGQKWEVHTQSTMDGENSSSEQVHSFDAAVICNGHYSQPYVPDIAGMAKFPGRQFHSHNYRNPKGLEGKTVLVVGAAASGVDISAEVASVAKSVYLSARKWKDADWGLKVKENLWKVPEIDRLEKTGEVVFKDGQSLNGVDVIMYCTGYKFCYPFLEDTKIVSAENGHVYPLYKHMFPPKIAPILSFVGLPWKVNPFPLFQYQSQYIAQVLSDGATLPGVPEMNADIEQHYRMLDENGVDRKYAHEMQIAQFEYIDWMVDQCTDSALPRLPPWHEEMFFATGQNKRTNPETYRDEWSDHEALSDAHADFALYGKSGVTVR